MARSFFVLRLFPTSYQFLGPYSEEQLCSEMKLGRISLSDLAYSPQDPGKWRRLIKFERLLECQPEVPNNKELIQFEDEAAERMRRMVPPPKKKKEETQAKKVSAKAQETKEKAPKAQPAKSKEPESESVFSSTGINSKTKIWYLQSEGTEFGPFNFSELGKIFDSGKLSGKIFVWKEGLVNWMEGSSLEQIITDLPQAERTKGFVIERGFNKRLHIRSALVATVSLTQGNKVHTGLCLDISEGGLQVGKWSAKVGLGDEFSLLITPLGLTGIAAFKADSVVTWVDEKLQRTGFRFKNFSKSEDQERLIKYLNDSQVSYR